MESRASIELGLRITILTIVTRVDLAIRKLTLRPTLISSSSIMTHLREIIDLVVDAVNRKTDKNGGCGNIGSVRKILGIWRGTEIV